MTPDNDVEKKQDDDRDTGENSQPETGTDSAQNNPVADNSVDPNGAVASDSDDVSVANSGEPADDIDRAADAQMASDDASDKTADNAGTNGDAIDNDDPLGFGSQRMSGDDGDDEVSQLRAQLGESEARLAQHAEQLLRMQADIENQRKRAQKDVANAHKFALEKIALDLLPVKDSLEMGLLAATGEDAEPEKIIEGSELTLKMLAQALEKYNIVELNPLDEKFDPEFHQAMSMQPVEGKEPNTVSGVLQKGYTLNDRLIRPALVMVAK